MANEFTDRRRIKVDKIQMDITTGAQKAHEHTGTGPEVVNVVYGTGSPPDVSTVPNGTLYIKYLP